MDGIANVAKQQQSQVQTQDVGTSKAQPLKVQKPQDNIEKIQKELVSENVRNYSEEDMQKLVDKLNSAIGPMSTNIAFGVDKDDIFYVSVLEAESKRVIRRFPAEKAIDLLPKMQEVTGILFDTKG